MFGRFGAVPPSQVSHFLLMFFFFRFVFCLFSRFYLVAVAGSVWQGRKRQWILVEYVFSSGKALEISGKRAAWEKKPKNASSGSDWRRLFIVSPFAVMKEKRSFAPFHGYFRETTITYIYIYILLLVIFYAFVLAPYFEQCWVGWGEIQLHGREECEEGRVVNMIWHRILEQWVVCPIMLFL